MYDKNSYNCDDLFNGLDQNVDKMEEATNLNQF